MRTNREEPRDLLVHAAQKRNMPAAASSLPASLALLDHDSQSAKQMRNFIQMIRIMHVDRINETLDTLLVAQSAIAAGINGGAEMWRAG